jgi:hypothetical protein
MVYLGLFALCLLPVSCAVPEQVTADNAESDMADAKVKPDKNNSFAKEIQTKKQTAVERRQLNSWICRKIPVLVLGLSSSA